MPAIDLKKFSGLSLSYEQGKLMAQESGIDISTSRSVSIDDIRPQLLNPDLSCPKFFYYYFTSVDRKNVLKRKNLRCDFYVVPSNLAGIEYVKTRGLDTGGYPVLVDVIHGFSAVILQCSCTSGPDSIPSTKSIVIKLKKGEKYIIPPGWKFVFVNTRQTISVISIIFSMKASFKSVFDESRGAASYVIRKNARQEIVQNPYYRNLVKMRSVKPFDLYKYFKLTAKTPIFKQILRKYERFKWLHEPEKIDWDKLPICK
ncbi:hypothetical protein JW887_05845 [Candidatus Dojkabacteria bacterium]|nr:hypothetical protein [Candidatus Dojkabacteria bacterium]